MGKALLAYSDPYFTPTEQQDLAELAGLSGDEGEVSGDPSNDGEGSETDVDLDETEVSDEAASEEVETDEGDEIEAEADEADEADEAVSDTESEETEDSTSSSDTTSESSSSSNVTDSSEADSSSTTEQPTDTEVETEETPDVTVSDEVEEPAVDAEESETELVDESEEEVAETVDESEEEVTETVDAAEESQDSNSSEPIEIATQFEFPEEDQPEIVVIESENSVAETESAVDGEGEVSADEASPQTESEELVKAVNSNAQVGTETVNADEWVTVLTEAVDNAKASNDSNAIVALNIALTEELDDGSIVPRTELTQSERAALTYARDNGVLVTLSAGDTAGEAPIINGVAAEFDNVVVVGAAEPANDATSVWKSYAATDSSATGVSLDLVADGRNGETVSTSVAASRVAGAISQVWAANPDLNYTQVVDILKRTATDLGEWNWDTETGSGLVNVVAAVHLAKVTKPQPYTVKPGARTIADNFIAQNPGGKSLPGDPTHPAVAPPGIPEHTVDSGANTLDAATALLPSPTQDIIDQVSANDPTDMFQVESRYIDGAELAVMSGEISVQYLSPSGAVLGSQTLSRGSQTLQLPDNAPEDVLVKIERVGQSPATYTLYGFESLAEEPFDIALEYDSPISASQQQILQAAAKSVASMVGQGLPTAVVDGKLIDDLNIKISTAALDGAGGTQARTKIDFMRYGTLLPAQSLVQLDEGDLDSLEQSGQLFDVARHEFLHALGYGNLWEAKGLIDRPNTSLARYNGANAVSAYQEAGGATETIALENQGVGTAGLHWNENLFGNELMSPDIDFGGDAGDAPVSKVTIASLADLGYEVNLDAATADYEPELGGVDFGGEEELSEEAIDSLKAFAAAAAAFKSEVTDEVAPIMEEVYPETIAPEIWANAERFSKNGEYYDWKQIVIGDWRNGHTISGYVYQYMTHASKLDHRSAGAKANDPAYWAFISNRNGYPDPNWIVKGDTALVPVWHPNYEEKQAQELAEQQAALEAQQQEEAEAQAALEAQLQEEAEAQALAELEAELAAEAAAKAKELEEQAQKLAEEQAQKEAEEKARLEEIERQQGVGGQDWYLATPLPEFGSVDPFETGFSGETVGHLVPDDYYRFTLSRKGRVTAELKELLADADLVLYDARNKPIAYSMREGVTDEFILADLIPGTYMLRVNSPEGVTTSYDLIVKFKHLLSLSEQGPPPGWEPGGGNRNPGGGGVPGPIFSDPRIQSIYDKALNDFKAKERAVANAKIRNLEAEKRRHEQDLQALLDQMNGEQRRKIHAALDGASREAQRWVAGKVDPFQRNIDDTANFITNKADDLYHTLNGWANKIPTWPNAAKNLRNKAKDFLRRGRDAVKGAVNDAKWWLKRRLDDIRNGVQAAIRNFFDTLKNAYRTGAEINGIIENAARSLKSAIDRASNFAKDLVGQFKGKILSAARWTKDLGIKINKWGIKVDFNVYDNIVKPAVNKVSGGFDSVISGIADKVKGAVDWVKPRAQKAVEVVVDAIFGDKTAALYNKINGVDQQIADTQSKLIKAIRDKAAELANGMKNFLANLGKDGKAILDFLLDFDSTSAGETFVGQAGMLLLEVGLGLIATVPPFLFLETALDIKDVAAPVYKIGFNKALTDGDTSNDLEVIVELIAGLAGVIPVVGNTIRSVMKKALKLPAEKLVQQFGKDTMYKVAKELNSRQWSSILIDAITKVLKVFKKFNSTLDQSAGWIIDLMPGLKNIAKDSDKALSNLLEDVNKVAPKIDESVHLLLPAPEEILLLPAPGEVLPLPAP
jgi:hypothetical protein